MLRTGKWIALILWGIPLLAASTLGQTPSPAHQRNLKMVRKPTAQPQASMPALRTGPLPQVPMDQIPSTAPQVSYQEGMLSIAAQNSSLGDILREVHKRTGATIDIPPNANERVVTHLGPGPARDVLASLLNGSGFNYVMVGSTSDPTSVASIILTTKAPGGGEKPLPSRSHLSNISRLRRRSWRREWALVALSCSPDRMMTKRTPRTLMPKRTRIRIKPTAQRTRQHRMARNLPTADPRLPSRFWKCSGSASRRRRDRSDRDPRCLSRINSRLTLLLITRTIESTGRGNGWWFCGPAKA